MLQDILSSFSCTQDADIENFLHTKAEEFESVSKARTYLVCDEEKMRQGEICILGYFTLALKVLILPDNLSVRARKEIDGYRGKIHGMPIREVPCYLIGQLARNSNVEKGAISGKELLEEACAVIEPAITAVGGRYVMIECHDNRHLLAFYKKNGFEEFWKEPLGDVPMVQMIRKLKNDVA